jgi:hypothetical protein
MRALALAIVLVALVAAPALACGPTKPGEPRIPPLAEPLDYLLSRTELVPAEREKVAPLRAQIGKLAAAGQEDAAREVEEQAMRILGYAKLWPKCGPGIFMWAKMS